MIQVYHRQLRPLARSDPLHPFPAIPMAQRRPLLRRRPDAPQLPGPLPPETRLREHSLRLVTRLPGRNPAVHRYAPRRRACGGVFQDGVHGAFPRRGGSP